MRKFDFDNLAILGMHRIDLFTPFADIIDFISPINLSFAAPQPMPLFAEINGTAGDDTLTGTTGDDVINGLAGDDIISGDTGDDILDGGTGRDTIYGGLGNDTLTGGSSNIFTIDYLYGGAGNDTLNVDAEGRRNFLIGGEGDDIINASESNTDFIVVFSSASLSDYEFTELNPNQYQVRALNGVMDGTDIINSVANPNGSVGIRLGGVDGTYYNLLELIQGENIDLTEGDDTYIGTYGDDTVNGLGGNDMLSGLVGADILNGGAGDDVLIGGEGNDTLDGGDGNDTASYLGGTYSAFIDLRANSTLGSASGDTLISIENLSGTTFRDVFRGDNQDNNFTGLEGDDLLVGREGNDTLIGGLGDDELEGGDNDDLLIAGMGHDTVDGGDGHDTAVYAQVNLSDYLIAGSESEGYTIIAATDRLALSEGQDDLVNVEALRLGGENGVDYVIGETAISRVSGTQNNDNLLGTSADDLILGRFGDDVLNGGDGDDVIIGGAGDDDLNGGNGDDWLYASSGYEEFNGGAGFDIVDYSAYASFIGLDLNSIIFTDIEGLIGNNFTQALIGNTEDNVIMGLGGDDSIRGREGVDTAAYLSADLSDYIITGDRGFYTVSAIGATNEGEDDLRGIEVLRFGGLDGTDYYVQQLTHEVNLTGGDDSYGGTTSAEFINGLGGDDLINGDFGDDILNGGAGNDTLDGGLGDDIINGDAGHDMLADIQGLNTLNGGAGDDTFFDTGRNINIFDGGEGQDTVSYEGFISTTPNNIRILTIDLVLGIHTGIAQDDTFISVENIIGSRSRNILRGDNGANELTGGEVDDYLSGRSGDDILFGLEGNDELIGGFGTDVAVYSSSDTADYVVTETAPGEYTVEAIGGTSEGTDTLTGIETIRLGGMDGTDYDISTMTGETNLTNGDDDYSGTAGDDVINGLAGNDIIRGLAGDDVLNGDAGDDILIGGLGGDSLNGGDGIDTASYVDAAEAATINLRIGTVLGAAIGDTYNSIENLTGSDFDDTLTGDFGVNILSGGLGDDVLNGDRGNDILHGGEGEDTLNGGNNNDVLNGDAGNDSLYGGAGIDSLYGGAGDDIIFVDLSDTFASLLVLDDAVIDGGAGTDILSMELPETINDFTTYRIDIRNVALSGIETLDYYWTGIAASVYSDLEITASQLNQISEFRNWFVRTDVFFDGVSSLDLTNLTYFGNVVETMFSVFGTAADETVIVSNSLISFDGGEGIDTAVYSSANTADYLVTEIAPGEYTIEAVGGTGEGTDTLIGVEFIRLGGINGTDYDITALATAPTNNLTNGDDIYDAIINGEIVNGLDGNDTLTARNSNITLNGDGGDDMLFDVLAGNALNTLNGGVGADTIYLEGAGSTANGGLGDDNINITNEGSFANGDAGNDIISATFVYGTSSLMTLNGGDGTDTLVFRFDEANIDDTEFYNFINSFGGTLDLYTGNTDGDYSLNLSGFERLDFIGGGRSDNIVGGAGDDIIQDGGTYSFIGDIGQFGNGNNDTIYGMAGDDIIIGTGGIDILDGGDGNDTITSGADIETAYEDYINQDFQYGLRASEAVMTGGAGDDIINSYGDDTLEGGAGDDILINHEDDAVAIYSSANAADYLVTETAPGEYTVEAIGGTGEGTDTLTGIQTIRLGGINGTDYAIGDLANAGTINLTNGDDVYSGTAADEVINALAGDDIIDGGTGNNTLKGDAGDDTLISLGNDVLIGGTGNDLIEMGGNVFDAATATDGGADIDTISFSTFAQLPSGNLFLVLDLQGQAYSVRDGSAILYVDQFTNFENATGSEFGDLLQGDVGVNVLMGLGGDDNLQGRDGDDIIDGGAGGDTLNGGDGIDLATYASAMAGVTAIMGDASLNTGDAAGDSYIDIENITGSDFDDVLGGDANANIIDGGGGRDIASYAYASSAIIFDALGLVTDSGDIVDDTFVNIEGIAGTAFNDRFFGDNDTSIFYGGEGADRLFGRNGDDELYGEDGNDIILGGRDNDLIDGGAGNDQLRGNEGDDTLLGGDGNDVLAGGAGADVLNGGAGIDRVEYTYGTNAGVTASLGDASINTGDAAGDSYIDIENLYGTTFNDTLHGDAGNNRIDGRLGDDMLFGGDGNDYLIGGAGDDVMNGEAGNDLFLGQAGADIYQFGAAHGTDRIIIFIQGEDLIEFTESVFDFSDLTLTQDGAHVNIDSAEGRVIANNSLVADFTTDDFIFASPSAQEPFDMGEQDMAMFIELDALI